MTSKPSEARSPYKKFLGKTLGEIGDSDEGLKYLDWLIGWMEDEEIRTDFYASLKQFVALPHISRAIELAIDKTGHDDDVPGAWHPEEFKKPWWERK